MLKKKGEGCLWKNVEKKVEGAAAGVKKINGPAQPGPARHGPC